MTEKTTHTGWAKLSLSTRILIGLGLGILTGFFFGEPAASLQVVADVYIRLMQMTVIPYVAVALMAGLGQLNLSQAKILARRGGLLILIFWAIAFIITVLMPLSFPEWQSGSFFSTSLVEPKKSFDFVELYIPANPFHSLANSIVPAVVIFSASLGIALIGIKKAALIENLQIVLQALTRVAKFVVGLTPIGVFAIAAVHAGTMTLQEFGRLHVYFVTFIAAALLLIFWIVPGLIAAVTPFRYKDILGVSKDALLTAFFTHNLFIVLPILIEHSKSLMEKYQLQSADSDRMVEVIIPVTFNFPNLGKLLSLLFVPFAAWLAGSPLVLEQYPGFFLTGVLSYFAKAQSALPFLMDQLEIPQDLFQLYLPTGIINGKFDTVLSAMNLVAFSLIGTGAVMGYLSVKPWKIFRYLIVSAVALILVVFGTGFFLDAVVDTTYQKGEVVKQMHLLNKPVKTTVHKPPLSKPSGSGKQPMSTLDKIRERGSLRAGYYPEHVPFHFVNEAGDLVGFGVEIVNLLVKDLGVGLEWIPTSLNAVIERVNNGELDLFPVAPYIPSWVTKIEHTIPYMEGTVAFVVEDHRRHDFSSLESMRRLKKVTVGTTLTPETIESLLEEYWPGVAFNLRFLDSAAEFFEKSTRGIDAFLETAEIGQAHTLLHPEYTVVIPKPRIWKVPLGFAVAEGSYEFANFLDDWIVTHQARGSFQIAYNYWILGQGAEQKGPRWSIIRDVLKWVE